MLDWDGFGSASAPDVPRRGWDYDSFLTTAVPRLSVLYETLPVERAPPVAPAAVCCASSGRLPSWADFDLPNIGDAGGVPAQASSTLPARNPLLTMGPEQPGKSTTMAAALLSASQASRDRDRLPPAVAARVLEKLVALQAAATCEQSRTADVVARLQETRAVARAALQRCSERGQLLETALAEAKMTGDAATRARDIAESRLAHAEARVAEQTRLYAVLEAEKLALADVVSEAVAGRAHAEARAEVYRRALEEETTVRMDTQVGLTAAKRGAQDHESALASVEERLRRRCDALEEDLAAARASLAQERGARETAATTHVDALADARREGYEQGFNEGVKRGTALGEAEGERAGRAAAAETAFEQGRTVGLAEGDARGLAKGTEIGAARAREEARGETSAMLERAREEGRAAGKADAEAASAARDAELQAARTELAALRGQMASEVAALRSQLELREARERVSRLRSDTVEEAVAVAPFTAPAPRPDPVPSAASAPSAFSAPPPAPTIVPPPASIRAADVFAGAVPESARADPPNESYEDSDEPVEAPHPTRYVAPPQHQHQHQHYYAPERTPRQPAYANDDDDEGAHDDSILDAARARMGELPRDTRVARAVASSSTVTQFPMLDAWARALAASPTKRATSQATGGAAGAAWDDDRFAWTRRPGKTDAGLGAYMRPGAGGSGNNSARGK